MPEPLSAEERAWQVFRDWQPAHEDLMVLDDFWIRLVNRYAAVMTAAITEATADLTTRLELLRNNYQSATDEVNRIRTIREEDLSYLSARLAAAERERDELRDLVANIEAAVNNQGKLSGAIILAVEGILRRFKAAQEAHDATE